MSEQTVTRYVGVIELVTPMGVLRFEGDLRASADSALYSTGVKGADLRSPMRDAEAEAKRFRKKFGQAPEMSLRVSVERIVTVTRVHVKSTFESERRV